MPLKYVWVYVFIYVHMWLLLHSVYNNLYTNAYFRFIIMNCYTKTVLCSVSELSKATTHVRIMFFLISTEF